MLPSLVLNKAHRRVSIRRVGVLIETLTRLEPDFNIYIEFSMQK